MRSFASGLEVFSALGHDFVLRHNVRIAFGSLTPSAFVQSTHGSHHVQLVSHIARLWNELVKKQSSSTAQVTLALRVTLPVPSSKELFGLVPSEYTSTFAGLLELKTKNMELEDHLINLVEDEINTNVIADEMGISPSLFLLPQAIGDHHPATTCALYSLEDLDTSVTAAATAVGGIELLHEPTDIKGKGREVGVPSLQPEGGVSVVIVSSDAVTHIP